MPGKGKPCFLWQMTGRYGRLLKRGIVEVGGRFKEITGRYKANRRKRTDSGRQGWKRYRQSDSED